jgi:hypothetical protein
MTDLFAPSAYWKLPEGARKLLCNGCGTKGLCGFIVPETVWGLPITPACDIHDFMYHVGETPADKDAADRVFLNNMLRIIDDKTRFRVLKLFRRRRAMTYYTAVAELGGPAFWSGKNDARELGKA